jgi:hypothetical protein
MKTLSHFERVKSFEEEVARLTVTKWISSARLGSCVKGGSTRGRAYGRQLARSTGGRERARGAPRPGWDTGDFGK